MIQETTTANIPTDVLGAKVLIVATVRDCAPKVATDVSQLAKAFSPFQNLHWFVVESDSSDGTLAVLGELKARLANFNFVSLGRLEQSTPLRTERIAYCRNRYLDELRSNPAYAGVEYLVVADLDNVQNLTSQDGVMSCFTRDDWAACTANQQGLYYDIWALRHPVWSPNDCWEQKFFLEKANNSSEKSAYSAVFSRMIEIDPSSAWIDVHSSFGGLGVYKTSYLSNCTYNGRADNDLWGGQVCEHVSFNAAIRSQGGRIFINPAMVNTALNEHSLAAIVPEDLLFPVNLKKENEDEDSDRGTKGGQLNVMSMTAEDIIGSYKVFLKRHPESMQVVQPRVGMTSDMVLVDFLTSAEFLNRAGIDKLISIMLNKIPHQRIPTDFLTASDYLKRPDVVTILSGVPSVMEAQSVSLDLLTSKEFLAQEGVDQLIVKMLEGYMDLAKKK